MRDGFLGNMPGLALLILYGILQASIIKTLTRIPLLSVVHFTIPIPLRIEDIQTTELNLHGI
jgi:hypothetical protein